MKRGVRIPRRSGSPGRGTQYPAERYPAPPDQPGSRSRRTGRVSSATRKPPASSLAPRAGSRPRLRHRAGTNRPTRGGGSRKRGNLFYGDHHGVRSGQVLHLTVAESGLLHPADAVRAGVIEAARSLDQHVQAHQEAEGVFLAVVVDDRVVSYERATRRQGGVGLGEEGFFLFPIPVVRDVPHHQHVGSGERIAEEVARDETETIGETVRADVFLEDRLYGRQIVPTSGEVPVPLGHVNRKSALRRSDVVEGPVTLPGELLCDGRGGP